MANDKITWVELRKLVAQNASLPEQEVSRFLDALLDAIIAGLKEDKQVKIKGIGTFSIKAVAPRKSVNIATGEAFTIEGYNKLTFNAEAALKENVEKRLEQPKTTEVVADILQDPIQKLGEQADEIVDILADLGQAPVHDTPSLPEEEAPSAEEMVEELIQEEKEEIIHDEIEEVSAEEKSAKDSKNIQTIITEEEDTVPPTTVAPTVIIHPKCLCNYWKWIGWTLLSLLLFGCIGAACYHRHNIVQWWQCTSNSQQIEAEETNITTIEEQIPICVEETIVEQEVVKEVPPAVVPLAEQPRKYTDFIATEVVTYGSRLTWIAYKYYGNKDLWVFIYEANRKLIDNPNYLRMKQEIHVPALNENLLDLSNPEVRQLVDDLAKQYLKQ